MRGHEGRDQTAYERTVHQSSGGGSSDHCARELHGEFNRAIERDERIEHPEIPPNPDRRVELPDGAEDASEVADRPCEKKLNIFVQLSEAQQRAFASRVFGLIMKEKRCNEQMSVAPAKDTTLAMR